jgi:hypothetical protein
MHDACRDRRATVSRREESTCDASRKAAADSARRDRARHRPCKPIAWLIAAPVRRRIAAHDRHIARNLRERGRRLEQKLRARLPTVLERGGATRGAPPALRSIDREHVVSVRRSASI